MWFTRLLGRTDSISAKHAEFAVLSRGFPGGLSEGLAEGPSTTTATRRSTPFARAGRPRTTSPFAQADLASFDPATAPLNSTTADADRAAGQLLGHGRLPSLTEIDAPPFPSIGPLGHRGRMRERVLDRGPDSLADYELLEMLLFFAFKKGDTKPLAKALINQFGSLAAILSAPQQSLLETEGLGPHSVTAIRLVREAAVRLARADLHGRPVLGNWDRLMDYLTTVLAREKVEQFRVLFLDNKNQLLADEMLGSGTVNHTPVYPREVVKRALELHATALILVHNHPSGDPTPSRDDVEMTLEIKQAAKLLSIVVHDHVVVGNGRWVSLKKEGYF